jgi:hypothetical protein
MISKYFTVVHASGGQANFRSRDFMDQMSIKDTVHILYKGMQLFLAVVAAAALGAAAAGAAATAA